MITATYRICIFALVALVITAGFAQAQIQIQQTPSVVVVKPNPVAAITGALLTPLTQNPNPPPISQSNNNATPSAGLAPYPSSNGACQTGYISDGQGYCVPYNSMNNSARASANPAPYGMQPCQPGYVSDGRGSCVSYPPPNDAALPESAPAPYTPTACSTGYVPDGKGSCVLPSVPQNQPEPPMHAPPATPTEDTSGDCPAGYALDHDGNCSFASETNPYQK